MQQLRHLPYAAVTAALAHSTMHMHQVREEFRARSDRGSNVVETIIIVAGFAGLAFTIYLAVSGKVQGWINKIPGTAGL